MYVSVKKGNYSISKAVVKANGGETIAGDISIGIDDGSVNASAQTITVTPPSPIDCTGEARLIPVMIAPVTLSQGYTVTLTDTDGPANGGDFAAKTVDLDFTEAERTASPPRSAKSSRSIRRAMSPPRLYTESSVRLSAERETASGSNPAAGACPIVP